jgi:tRNA(Arg) A34 adenosine deaminase TadA
MDISNKNERYLCAAIDEAQKSTMLFKLGAIVCDGSKIMSTGYNNYRSCINRQSIPSCHAEIDALRRYLKVAKGYYNQQESGYMGC